MSARPARIVLVGLSGAGKSTVGPLVAAGMRRDDGQPWSFVDLDAEIERRTGRSVPEIFARQGEAAFRKLERAVSGELAMRRELVVATGGGWVELTDAVQRLSADAMLVYLAVSPEVAVARIQAQGGGRPLLAGDDPAAKLRELFGRRESMYLQAQHTVSVDLLRPDAVASYIVALATGGTRD